MPDEKDRKRIIEEERERLKAESDAWIETCDAAIRQDERKRIGEMLDEEVKKADRAWCFGCFLTIRKRLDEMDGV
jgi:hypothetical protein